MQLRAEDEGEHEDSKWFSCIVLHQFLEMLKTDVKERWDRHVYGSIRVWNLAVIFV